MLNIIADSLLIASFQKPLSNKTSTDWRERDATIDPRAEKRRRRSWLSIVGLRF